MEINSVIDVNVGPNKIIAYMIDNFYEPSGIATIDRLLRRTLVRLVILITEFCIYIFYL